MPPCVVPSPTHSGLGLVTCLASETLASRMQADSLAQWGSSSWDLPLGNQLLFGKEDKVDYQRKRENYGTVALSQHQSLDMWVTPSWTFPQLNPAA